MTSRRDVLKAGMVLSLAGLAAPGTTSVAGASPRFLIDSRLPEAAQLRRQAAAGGHPHADPYGEIVALLMNQPQWLARDTVLVGLTGYVDHMLARDVLRSAGRRVRQVWQLGPSGVPAPAPAANAAIGAATDRAIAALLGTSCLPTRPGATGFLWIA